MRCCSVADVISEGLFHNKRENKAEAGDTIT